MRLSSTHIIHCAIFPTKHAAFKQITWYRNTSDMGGKTYARGAGRYNKRNCQQTWYESLLTEISKKFS
jgi:hypothetical protein